MKLRLIFGVIIPLVIIITLAILGALPYGFSVRHNFVSSLNANDLISDGKIKSHIELGSVVIVNDYFLGKRYDLQPLIACLRDKESTKATMDAGSVVYSEGDYNYNDELGYYPPYQQNSRSV